MASDDLFEDLHNLEDKYYQEGYALGVEDGSRAGRIEGRTFGLEKGFEKFFAMGKLQGRSEVLEARLHVSTTQDRVKPLNKPERVEKHIRTMSALTELESLSTANNEDAVSEFDDRFKRAQAKAKVIDTILGSSRTSGSATNTKENIEDFGVVGSRC